MRGIFLIGALAGREPERDMRRLHGGIHRRHQLIGHLAQINVAAQCGAEGGDGLGSVVFVAVEAAVNEGLEAAAQRLEGAHRFQR